MRIKVIDSIVYFYNVADGHTYTKSMDKWIAYPTLSDGAIDIDNMFYCDCLDFGVSDEDKAQINEFMVKCQEYLDDFGLFTILRDHEELNKVEEEYECVYTI